MVDKCDLHVCLPVLLICNWLQQLIVFMSISMMFPVFLWKSESRFQFYSRMQNLRSVNVQPLEQDDENQPELPAQVRAELLEQGGDGEALRQGPPGPGEGQLQLWAVRGQLQVQVRHGQAQDCCQDCWRLCCVPENWIQSKVFKYLRAHQAQEEPWAKEKIQQKSE